MCIFQKRLKLQTHSLRNKIEISIAERQNLQSLFLMMIIFTLKKVLKSINKLIWQKEISAKANLMIDLVRRSVQKKILTGKLNFEAGGWNLETRNYYQKFSYFDWNQSHEYLRGLLELDPWRFCQYGHSRVLKCVSLNF